MKSSKIAKGEIQQKRLGTTEFNQNHYVAYSFHISNVHETTQKNLHSK